MSGAPSAAAIVRFDNVSIVFGPDPDAALPLMDQGLSRDRIKTETGQVLGVHDCRLDVAEGEILVLMGLSGSGKSTLLRAVNGLNPVVRGACLVREADGSWVDPARCPPAALRRLRGGRVAMVFQNFGLLPWRTVEENVGLGLELAGTPTEARREKVRQNLDLVGLGQWAGRKVGELSGGMRQRVGLARAFATEAPILLMDEPFSALDPLIRARLQDELLDFQRRLRKTIVFVSHDLDEAVKLGNRIAIMEGGRIIQHGAPPEIILTPADGYVADFVAHMNPVAVLRASDVMRPLNGAAGGAAAVAHDAPMGEVLRVRVASGGPVLAGPAPGAPADAVIEDDAVFGALARRPAAPA
jgi:glycine betaine/proline transport system ATP-binding protein